MRSTSAFIGIIIAAISISFLWQQYTFGTEKYERIIDSDGKGYVAYLPALFIYHDLSFSFYNLPENASIARYFNDRFLTPAGHKTVLKTYCGVAVMLLPFYLLGCLTQVIFFGHTNGFEPIIQFFMSAGGIAYAAAGVIMVHKLLIRLGFEIKVAALTAFTLLAGTNLFYYALFHPTMSHPYSFFLIAAFLLLSERMILANQYRLMPVAAITLGLIALVRPLNVVIILVPLLLAGTALQKMIKQQKRNLLISLLSFLAIISIQPLLNYYQCGQLFPWNYGDEGFYFSHPALFKALFSFRNGLFVYSPVLILTIPGLICLWKQKPTIVMPCIIMFLLLWYLISSWWNWSSEPAFGNRSFIDWYAVLSIPIACTMASGLKKARSFLIILIVALVALNMLQTWQYLKGIIHPDGMTFEKYQYVFLKTSDEYIASVGNGNEESYLPPVDTPFYQNTSLLSDLAYDSTGVSGYDSDNLEFNAAIKNRIIAFIPLSDYVLHPMMAKVSLKRIENEFKACTAAEVCFDYVNANGVIYYHENLRINDIPRKKTGEWKTFNYQFVMPAMKSKSDQLVAYISNPHGKNFVIKDIKIALYNFKTSP
jgi:hypothetical protein